MKSELSLLILKHVPQRLQVEPSITPASFSCLGNEHISPSLSTSEARGGAEDGGTCCVSDLRSFHTHYLIKFT